MDEDLEQALEEDRDSMIDSGSEEEQPPEEDQAKEKAQKRGDRVRLQNEQQVLLTPI